MKRPMTNRISRACAAAAASLVVEFSIAPPLPAALSLAVALPSVSVGATAADAAPATTTSANSAPATTTSTDSAPADDIRDIRGPKGIFPVWRLATLLAAGALLAVGGYAAWRWTRRRASPHPLQLFEIALQRLEDIRTLMRPSSVREFSIAISDIVRRYIEDQFKVTATHRTTEEFLRDLLESSNASLAAHRNLLAQFLQQCDMAKFAGVGLSMQIMETLHQSARSFVIESSKPLPTAESHGAARSTRTREAHDSLPST